MWQAGRYSVFVVAVALAALSAAVVLFVTSPHSSKSNKPKNVIQDKTKSVRQQKNPTRHLDPENAALLKKWTQLVKTAFQSDDDLTAKLAHHSINLDLYEISRLKIIFSLIYHEGDVVDLMSKKMRQGDCSMGLEQDELNLISVALNFFITRNAAKKYQLDSEFLRFDHNNLTSVVNKASIVTSFGIADAALEGHCLHIAVKYYTKISQLTDNDLEMRRAQIGIESAQSQQQR